MRDVYSENIISAQRLDDSPTSYTSKWVDVSRYDKVGFCFASTKTLTPTSVTYTVEAAVAPTGRAIDSDGIDQPTGATARAIDMLISKAGDDGPVASIAHTATAVEWAVLYPGLGVKWLRVVATGSGTDATNFFDSTVTIFGQYGG